MWFSESWAVSNRWLPATLWHFRWVNSEKSPISSVFPRCFLIAFLPFDLHLSEYLMHYQILFQFFFSLKIVSLTFLKCWLSLMKDLNGLRIWLNCKYVIWCKWRVGKPCLSVWMYWVTWALPAKWVGGYTILNAFFLWYLSFWMFLSSIDQMFSMRLLCKHDHCYTVMLN
jgi:hypothetical protein